jgi:hypothetical protein
MAGTTFGIAHIMKAQVSGGYGILKEKDHMNVERRKKIQNHL